MSRQLLVAATALLVTFSNGSISKAAELKVIGSPDVTGAITELSRQFEAATSHKVFTDYEVLISLPDLLPARSVFQSAARIED